MREFVKKLAEIQIHFYAIMFYFQWIYKKEAVVIKKILVILDMNFKFGFSFGREKEGWKHEEG